MSLVYLAGPISGLAFDEANDWRSETEAKFAAVGIDSASPLRFKDFLKDELKVKDNYTHPLATSKGIYTRDKFDVSRSDVILVNFIGAEKVSIGTVIELGWADMLNKPVVIATDNGIHDHAMISEIAGYIVGSLDEAIQTVIAILDPSFPYWTLPTTPFYGAGEVGPGIEIPEWTLTNENPNPLIINNINNRG